MKTAIAALLECNPIAHAQSEHTAVWLRLVGNQCCPCWRSGVRRLLVTAARQTQHDQQ